jgi:ferredoxin
MAKKVRVNKDLCIGCGLCAGTAPDAFQIGDDGKAEPVTGEAEDDVADTAVENCPVGAIEAE